MASLAVTIAEAVKDALNAAPDGTFATPFAAVREWAPYRKVEDLPAGDIEPLVLVVPVPPWSIGFADRARDEHRIMVDVAVQKKLAGVENEEIDALALIGEQIRDYLRGQRTLATTPAASYSGGEPKTIASANQIRNQRAFLAVWTFTYLVIT